MCYNKNNIGNLFKDLILQYLSQYIIFINGIIITCIVHTNLDQIFFRNQDDHLYELIYSISNS